MKIYFARTVGIRERGTITKKNKKSSLVFSLHLTQTNVSRPVI